MYKWLAIPLLVLSSIGCKEETDADLNMHCPCHSNLSTKKHYGLGSFKIGMGDNHDVIGECVTQGKFHYVNDQKGGIGSSLVEAGCKNDSVELVWQFGGLVAISVTEGWLGRTDTNLRIGDSIEDYLDRYPKAKMYTGDAPNEKLSFITPHCLTKFDENGKIEEMIVKRYSYKNELKVDKKDHVCPCEETLFTQKEKYNYDKTYKKTGLGSFKLNMPVSYFLENNCDFRRYKELEPWKDMFIGCGDSVYMEWLSNDLYIVSVRQGWEGQTDRGIKIGDSLEKFLEAYPKAKKKDAGTYPNEYNIYTHGYFKASFDSKEKIDMMSLLQSEDDDYDWTTPIVPWQKEPY